MRTVGIDDRAVRHVRQRTARAQHAYSVFGRQRRVVRDDAFVGLLRLLLPLLRETRPGDGGGRDEYPQGETRGHGGGLPPFGANQVTRLCLFLHAIARACNSW